MDQLRSYEEFQRSLRCYDWLPPEVSGGSDIDQMLERHGKVLFIESKRRHGPRISVPLGQWLAFLTLSGLPNVKVWLIAEDESSKTDDTTPRYSLLRISPDTKPHGFGNGRQKTVWFYLDSSFEHLNLAQLKNRVKSWWMSA